MLFLPFVSSLIVVVAASDLFDECRKTPKFSTKTGYSMVPTAYDSIVRPPNYKPIQVNMVFRHGERFPSSGNVAELNELANKINTQNATLSSNVNLTLPWYPKFNGKEERMLAKEGETVLYDIGKRLRGRFPEVFQKTYTTYNYKYISSCLTRTAGSADSIAMGIYDGHGHLGNSKLQPIHLEVNPCNTDHLLRGQDNCERYKEDVDDNDEAVIEVTKFSEGPEIKSVIASLKKKFGNESMELSFDDVKAMYEYCSFSIIMFNSSLTTGMCSVFTPEELSIIEYHEDMDDYYKRSTGHNISYQASCVLLKDMYQSLQSKIKGSSSDYPQLDAILRAGHSQTMIPLYTLLGIYTNEIPMKADNYEENRNRTFRVGCISPFSSNLMFVLYKSEINVNDYKIQLYVNERITRIPGCSEDSCDFAVFEDHYKNIVDRCNYSAICDLPMKPKTTPVPCAENLLQSKISLVVYLLILVLLKFY